MGKLPSFDTSSLYFNVHMNCWEGPLNLGLQKKKALYSMRGSSNQSVPEMAIDGMHPTD